MRVALFFDGKNFYSGLKDQAPSSVIDFKKMSQWLVERVGGSHLWGAYYYTGVETGQVRNEGQIKLAGFLDMLDLQPGFFVKRFPRKVQSFSCHSCGTINRYTLEKEIDTTMVADMLRLAAVDAFDVLVLMSGDADLTPAVSGVRAIGKQAYVATWGKTGLSARIRKAAFDHIELLDGLDSFGRNNNGGQSSFAGESVSNYGESSGGWRRSEESHELKGQNDEHDMNVFLEELSRAQQTFYSGYVGMNYFIKRWQSDQFVDQPDRRRYLLDMLADQERVEVYDAPDGNKAIRIINAELDDETELDDEAESDDDVEYDDDGIGNVADAAEEDFDDDDPDVLDDED